MKKKSVQYTTSVCHDYNTVVCSFIIIVIIIIIDGQLLFFNFFKRRLMKWGSCVLKATTA